MAASSTVGSQDAEGVAFFYGTLMAPAVLKRVIFGDPRNHSTTERPLPTPLPALLPGHRRHRVKNCDYPAVVPSDDSSVRGTLVTGLTSGDIYRLDMFEGEDYDRQVVKVWVDREAAKEQIDSGHEWDLLDEQKLKDEGEEVLAQCYIWKSGSDDLEPEEWDFKEFKEEKLWRWAGGHAEYEHEYSELDEAVNVSSDPTGGRNFNGGTITSALEKLNKEELESAV